METLDWVEVSLPTLILKHVHFDDVEIPKDRVRAFSEPSA